MAIKAGTKKEKQLKNYFTKLDQFSKVLEQT